MILTSDYGLGPIFWRTFNTNDHAYRIGLREGVLKQGERMRFDHPDGSFKMEIRKGGLGAPRLIDPGVIIANSTDLTLAGVEYLSFMFHSAIGALQRGRILDRHWFGHLQSASCGNITQQEKEDLYKTYWRGIYHYLDNTTPNINARTFVGASEIWLSDPAWFNLSDDEAAQTLIHEMMHCASYNHPDRRNPNLAAGQSCTSPDPAQFDCPYDNGQYYGTAPLRAQLCIAGKQSRIAQGKHTDCSIDAFGKATLTS